MRNKQRQAASPNADDHGLHTTQFEMDHLLEKSHRVLMDDGLKYRHVITQLSDAIHLVALRRARTTIAVSFTLKSARLMTHE